jgi:hypothetical protein
MEFVCLFLSVMVKWLSSPNDADGNVEKVFARGEGRK